MTPKSDSFIQLELILLHFILNKHFVHNKPNLLCEPNAYIRSSRNNDWLEYPDARSRLYGNSSILYTYSLTRTAPELYLSFQATRASVFHFYTNVLSIVLHRECLNLIRFLFHLLS